MGLPTLVAPVVVVLPEEIDITNARAMREQLSSPFRFGITVVVADLTSTWFCDMSGYRNLLSVHEEARAGGAELRVVVHPGGVWRALKLLGLDRILSVYPDVERARTGAA